VCLSLSLDNLTLSTDITPRLQQLGPILLFVFS
jgi:hypothetical protein